MPWEIFVTPDPDSTCFELDGRLWLRRALDAAALSALDAAFALAGRPGARINLTAILREAVGPGSALGLQLDTLWPGVRPVRALAFDKTPGQNWGVPCHARPESGIVSRRPPSGTTCCLCACTLIRLTLQTGPWKLHWAVIGAARLLRQMRRRLHKPARQKCVRRTGGDILVLKMLTLHRSSPATTARSRRTYRVDFAAVALPVPLNWAG